MTTSDSSRSDNDAQQLKSLERSAGTPPQSDPTIDDRFSDSSHKSDDDDSDDEDFDEDPDGELTEDGNYSESNRRSRNRRIFCFSCNRPEGHFVAYRGRWMYSLAVGLTFGLILFVGPFRCRCCGSPRLMSTNGLNPRYWFRPGSSRSRIRSHR